MLSWAAISSRVRVARLSDGGTTVMRGPCAAYWLMLFAFSWAAACTFPADYTGTSFQCTDSLGCPPGFECWKGRCVPEGEVPGRDPTGKPFPDREAGPNDGPDAAVPPDRTDMDAGRTPHPDSGPETGDPDGGPVSPDAGPVLPPGPPKWFAALDYPRALGSIGATTFKGLIHIVGGDPSYAGGEPTREHRTYDGKTNAYAARAAAPDDHQWGPCVLAHGEFIYSFGGWSAGGKLMRRYHPASDTWQYMAQSPQSHTWAFACGKVNSVIYIVAGSTSQKDAPTDRVSAYHIASDSWTTKAPFPVATFALTGAAIGTKLYVVGRDEKLDIYDTESDKWSTGPSLDRNAHHSSMAAYGGSLYVFGGLNASDVDRFDPRQSAWTALPAMSSPRMYAATAVLDNQIHLIGGFAGKGDKASSIHEYLLIP